MNLNFQAVIAELGPDFAFRLANRIRPPADYAFARILPEIRKEDYTVKSGTMTVRALMAGLVGMDSNYPPTGFVSTSKFLEETAKIASRVPMNEEQLRQLQQMATRIAANGGDSAEALTEEVLNFTELVIIQSIQDTNEWLRGQAIAKGSIDWRFGGLRLRVQYHIPAENQIATATGNNGWGGSTSTFWADYRKALAALRYNVDTRYGLLMHPNLAYKIIDNPANNIEIAGQTDNTFQIRRIVGTTERLSTDQRDSLLITTYAGEGEMIDPTDPSKTIKVPFMPDNRAVLIGRNTRPAYRVGMGSQTQDPNENVALGYSHLAPTVEGGGTPGMWARVYTPEGRPMNLVGEGAENFLPVIERPELLVHLSTE